MHRLIINEVIRWLVTIWRPVVLHGPSFAICAAAYHHLSPRPRTPTETREVLRRTRTKLLDLNIEHVPVKFGPQSVYKTWDIDGLGDNRRLVVSSNLDHPMFSFVNDTITWIKHNIAEAAAEYLSKEAGVEDMLKIKSDILRFVGELEVAEEEQEQDARVS